MALSVVQQPAGLPTQPLQVLAQGGLPVGPLRMAPAPATPPAPLPVVQQPAQQTTLGGVQPLPQQPTIVPDPNNKFAQPLPPETLTKIATDITTARTMTKDDNAILQALVQKQPALAPDVQTAITERGATPTQVLDQIQQKYGQQDQGTGQKSVLGYIGNTIGSTGSLIKNVAEGLLNILNTNPDQNTVVNVAKLAGGLLASPVIIGHNLITGKTPGEAGAWQLNDKPLQNFTDNLANRYGSIDKFKETLYKDTPGVLLDLATILDPAARGLGLTGDALDASNAATMASKTRAVGIAAATDNPMLRLAATQFAGDSTNIASKLGEVTSKVSEAINPINAMAKPIDWAKAGLENLAPKLEEANLRLTPTQKVNFANKIDGITNYIAKELPTGSPETRYEAIIQKSADMEDKVQTFLKADAKGITVDRNTLTSQTEALKSEFAGQRDALEIDRQIDGFKTLLEAKYPTQIPVTDLNTLKRSTFESAFNAAGTKVSDAVEFRLGDMLYDNLKTATKDVGSKSLQELNKEYSTVINAKKLLKAAMGRPQVGFIDKLVTGVTGGIIGNAFGGPIGSAVGGFIGKSVADHIPATGIKSFIGKTATKAAKLIPAVSPRVSSQLGAVSRLQSLTKPPAKPKK